MGLVIGPAGGYQTWLVRLRFSISLVLKAWPTDGPPSGVYWVGGGQDFGESALCGADLE